MFPRKAAVAFFGSLRSGHCGVCLNRFAVVQPPFPLRSAQAVAWLVRGWALPTLVLGGGGYTVANVARCWAAVQASVHGPQCMTQKLRVFWVDGAVARLPFKDNFKLGHGWGKDPKPTPRWCAC